MEKVAKLMVNNKTRANVYKLLAHCYQSPCLVILEAVPLLQEEVAKIYPEMHEEAANLAKQAPAGTEEWQKLSIDYAKLFVGPFELLAPPYGSVYLDGNRRVMGDTTLEAIQIYERTGLKIAADFKELPDHVAVELEFMYFLIFKGLQESTEDQQKEFLDNHLGRWVGSFSEAIEENAGTEFYRSLANLTRNFVQRDMHSLKAG